MDDIFSSLRETAFERTGGLDAGEYPIRGLWRTELVFRPNPGERAFHYTYMLAQVLGQGCCYCSSETCLDENIVGKPASDYIDLKSCVGISVLDAIYASFEKSPAESHELRGNSVQKTHLRNSIIADEVERLCDCDERDEIYLLNVGVVGDLVKKLRDRKFNVSATDLDGGIIGRKFHGVEIEHGEKTMEFVKKSDLAIISGMTIATDTLEQIIEVAKENETLLLMFAETGANFGEEYCRKYGIDTVVSEPFPFYIFQGVSTIDIYRRVKD